MILQNLFKSRCSLLRYKNYEKLDTFFVDPIGLTTITTSNDIFTYVLRTAYVPTFQNLAKLSEFWE